MQIAICDDLKAERNTLREYIDSYSCAEVLDYVIEEFENAESLLAEIKRGQVSPDILFMDIYMDGMSGMEAVKLLKAEGFLGAVVFITTSESHAVESYKIMADGYLVKPYSRDDFNQNFKRAIGSCLERFLRCHRGCIVNLNYVARVEDDHILMKDGAKTPLTIKGKPSIKKAVFDYFFLIMRGNR